VSEAATSAAASMLGLPLAVKQAFGRLTFTRL
jgi:hypothetical protein